MIFFTHLQKQYCENYLHDESSSLRWNLCREMLTASGYQFGKLVVTKYDYDVMLGALSLNTKLNGLKGKKKIKIMTHTENNVQNSSRNRRNDNKNAPLVASKEKKCRLRGFAQPRVIERMIFFLCGNIIHVGLCGKSNNSS